MEGKYMSVAKLIIAMRIAQPETIFLVKAGKFYNYFESDTVILNYLFDYKINKNELKDCGKKPVLSGGFPITNLEKVTQELYNKKINYFVLDNQNSYEVVDKKLWSNNRYEEFYNKGTFKIKNVKKLETFYSYLNESKMYPEFSDEIDKLMKIFLEDFNGIKEKYSNGIDKINQTNETITN